MVKFEGRGQINYCYDLLFTRASSPWLPCYCLLFLFLFGNIIPLSNYAMGSINYLSILIIDHQNNLWWCSHQHSQWSQNTPYWSRIVHENKPNHQKRTCPRWWLWSLNLETKNLFSLAILCIWFKAVHYTLTQSRRKAYTECKDTKG